jgi:hypothetical protein
LKPLIAKHFVTKEEINKKAMYDPIGEGGIKYLMEMDHNRIFFCGGTMNFPGLFDFIKLEVLLWFKQDQKLKKLTLE